MSFNDSQKLFLQEKIPNIYTWSNSVHIFFCQGWRMTTKFSMDMSDMCDRVTGSLKIFESIISQNQGIRESEKAAKILFLVLFPSSQLHLTQMTTITDTDLKNHVACLNALTNLCSKFYYYFQRVTYAKNIHNTSLITLFRGL